MLHTHHLLNYEQTVTSASLQLDLDPEAERVVIQDRETLTVFWHGRAKTLLNIRVPVNYAAKDNLLITLIDDTRKFDAKSVDFVVAKLDE